jgi:hypothetical protein
MQISLRSSIDRTHGRCVSTSSRKSGTSSSARIIILDGNKRPGYPFAAAVEGASRMPLADSTAAREKSKRWTAWGGLCRVLRQNGTLAVDTSAREIRNVSTPNILNIQKVGMPTCASATQPTVASAAHDAEGKYGPLACSAGPIPPREYPAAHAPGPYARGGRTLGARAGAGTRSHNEIDVPPHPSGVCTGR